MTVWNFTYLTRTDFRDGSEKDAVYRSIVCQCGKGLTTIKQLRIFPGFEPVGGQQTANDRKGCHGGPAVRGFRKLVLEIVGTYSLTSLVYPIDIHEYVLFRFTQAFAFLTK